MPDAGDFERDTQARAADPGWGDAFATLPQDAPDAGAWQRVQARLPAPTAQTAHARLRWPLWLATAASLVLVVAIPLRLLPRAGSDARVVAAPATSAATASVGIAAPPAPTPAMADVPARVATPVANRDASPPVRQVASSQRPIRARARMPDTTRVAVAEAASSVDLEPLYAQSAQLEDLLAMARDDRVANGTTAALSGDLDARMAAIDTALIQPGIDIVQRADLWRRRVDALQQLLGIETTNRLYAARGQSYDAALVSID